MTAEALSEPIRIWHLHEDQVSKEQRIHMAPGSAGEWSQVFRNMRRARLATKRTMEDGGIDAATCSTIVNDLSTGLDLLTQAHGENWRVSSYEGVAEVTATIQRDAFRSLEAFINPPSEEELID